MSSLLFILRRISGITIAMFKSRLTKPTIIMLYGLPGSGKSFFARQASDLLGIPHISSDRIRYELFETPTFSKDEQAVVFNIMMIMLEQFTRVGMSAILDVSLSRQADRKLVREYSKKNKYENTLLWIQSDAESCFARTKNRDRRKSDDMYSADITRGQFDDVERGMQAPAGEDAMVISGKHLFDSQKNVFLRKLREMQLLADSDALGSGFAKPGMVNLVSSAQRAAGRVDPSRRNVNIG
jgi:predicted kinase